MSSKSNITIEFDWEDPQGARGEELRATWARLQIRVGGISVLKVEDMRSRGIRDGVYLPLYPMAEWLAFNWWALFSEVPGGRVSDSFLKRHNLRLGREGFALPDLIITPEGGSIQVEWHPADLPECPVRFIERGSDHLDETQARDEFTRFVEAVVLRLEQNRIQSTLLQEHWEIVREAKTNGEAEFCVAAGALGLDPYCLEGHMQDAILSVHAKLPKSTWVDFLYLATPDCIQEQAESLCVKIRDLQSTAFDLKGIRELRMKLGSDPNADLPWKRGYHLARKVRELAGIGETPITSMEEMCSFFRLNQDDLGLAVRNDGNDRAWFDALMTPNLTGSPAFFIARGRKDSIKFAFCRALYGYLVGKESEPILVSSARSENQKSNRAFAAEFLAPAELIRSRLPETTLGPEDVDEIAADYGVSSWVICYQIQNHRLARLEPADAYWP